METDTDSIRWLGHASCHVRLGELSVLTDPLLRRRVGHLTRWEPLDRSTIDHIDAVLLSHAHHDHLDVRSLRWIARQRRNPLPVLAPLGADRLARRIKGLDVRTVKPGDQCDLDGVQVDITAAIHDGARAPWTRRRGDEQAVGFVLRGKRTVYYPGDSSNELDLDAVGPVDIALLPVGGWWRTLGPGHMDPDEAYAVACALPAKTVVPIHWGTLRPIMTRRILLPERELPVARLEALAQANPSGPTVRVLRPGESVQLHALAP